MRVYRHRGIVDFFLARKSGELYVGGCTVPEEIRQKSREICSIPGGIRKLRFQLPNAS
jgi:hypothetical protein